MSKLVSQYLINSYLYYVLHETVISDEEYDDICKKLLEDFDNIKHPHKHFLDREALKAGTAYHIKGSQYPTIVRYNAYRLYWKKKEIDISSEQFIFEANLLDEQLLGEVPVHKYNTEGNTIYLPV